VFGLFYALAASRYREPTRIDGPPYIVPDQIGSLYRAVVLWALASCVNAAGFMLYALRGAIPDAGSVLAANGALFTAIALNLAGINRFLGRPRPGKEWIAAGLAATAVAALVPFTYRAPDLAARTVIVNLALGSLNGLCAWSLLRTPADDVRGAARFTAAVFAMSAAWSLLRALLALLGRPESVFSPTLLQTLTFLLPVGALLLGTGGVLAMMVQRLLAEMRRAQAAERAALERAAADANHRAAEIDDLNAELMIANALIRENEQFFRLLFDRSPLGAALAMPDSVFVRANDTLCATLGYSEDRLLRRSVFDIAHPEDRPMLEQAAARLLAGEERVSVELRALRADGEAIWLQVTAGVVRAADCQPQHFLVVTEDITARKLVERRLRTIEQQQKLVLRTIPEQFWLKDTAGRYVLASASLARFHGRQPEEFIGRTADEIFPADLSAFIRNGDAITRERQHFDAEVALTDHTGAVRWLTTTRAPVYDDDGSLLGIVGVSRDITAYKDMQAALQRRVEELLALNQIAQALTTWTSVRDGAVTVAVLLCRTLKAGQVAIWEAGSKDGALLPLVQSAGGGPAPATRPLALEAIGLAPDALERQNVAMVPLAPNHPLFGGAAMDAPDARDTLILTLQARNAGVGLLCIQAAAPTQHFTPDVVALAQTVAGMLAGALDNARLFAQAQQTAAQQERQRLARELHDSVSQALFAANRTAEMLPQLWELDPEDGRAALSDLHRFTSGAMAEMRALLIELRPRALVDAPLHETLGFLVSAAQARSTATVTASLVATPLLPPEVQIALYRVTQEALHNAAKHARARHVTVAVAVVPPCDAGVAWAGCVTISVVDDGRGFAPATSPAGHFGLAMMRERAADIGASLLVISALGSGTAITIRWQGAQRPA
jgi:PAS domain S-box-containing protein